MAPKRKITLTKNSSNKINRTDTAIISCEIGSENENNVQDVFKNRIIEKIENMEKITKLALSRKDFDYKKLKKEKENISLMKLLADANKDRLEQEMNTLKFELKMQDEKHVKESHKNEQLVENMNKKFENFKTEYNKVKIDLNKANEALVERDKIVEYMRKALVNCYEQIGKLKQDADISEKRVKSVENENQELNKTIHNKENEREFFSRENQNLENALKAATKQLVEKDESITSLQLDLASHNEQILELKQVVEQVEEKVSTIEIEKCALSKSLQDKNIEMDHMANENEEMNEKVKNFQIALDKHIKERQDLEIKQKTRSKKYKRVKEKYKKLIYAIKKTNDLEIDNLKNIIQKSESKYKNLERELQTKLEEDGKNSSRIEKQQEELAVLKNKFKAKLSESHGSSQSESDVKRKKQQNKDVKGPLTEKLSKEKDEETKFKLSLAVREKIKNGHEQKQTHSSTELKANCNLESKESIGENPAKEDLSKNEVVDKSIKMVDHHADINIQKTEVILIENLSNMLTVPQVIKKLRRIGTLLEYWVER